MILSPTLRPPEQATMTTNAAATIRRFNMEPPSAA
jgi:hypothetical protein